MKKPKVFVVVLNWNRANLTIDCLKSIQKLQITGFDLETLVIDNNSSDDSVKQIQNSGFKVKIIENQENLGFAEGNNVGIRYALQQKADYVMILNNDTIVDKELVKELLKVAEGTENFGAASPKIYFAKGFEFHKKQYQKADLGKVIWYAGGKIDWENIYGQTRGVDKVDRGQFNEVCETDFATGTCFFAKGEVLGKVGLFDKKYFMYYEDTDLSQRMKRAGFKVLFVPQAIVWHKVAQSSAIGSELNDYFTTRNRLLFGLRWAKVQTKMALLRESIKLLSKGRKWQRIGVRDFYLAKFGKGSWRN